MKKYGNILGLIVFFNFYTAGIFPAVIHSALPDTLVVVDTLNNPRTSFVDSLQNTIKDATSYLQQNSVPVKIDSVVKVVKPDYKYIVLKPYGVVSPDSSFFVKNEGI